MDTQDFMLIYFFLDACLIRVFHVSGFKQIWMGVALCRYVNWQRWTQMCSFFRLITRSTNPCVIALMFMSCLFSGFTEGLMAEYAALVALMQRLVQILSILKWWFSMSIDLSFLYTWGTWDMKPIKGPLVVNWKNMLSLGVVEFWSILLISKMSSCWSWSVLTRVELRYFTFISLMLFSGLLLISCSDVYVYRSRNLKMRWLSIHQIDAALGQQRDWRRKSSSHWLLTKIFPSTTHQNHNQCPHLQ